MHGARLIRLQNIPVRRYCRVTASIFAKRRQINIEVVCGGRPSGQPGKLAPQRQDNVNTVGLQKFRSLGKIRLYGTLGREQDQQQMSAAPSHQNTSALERIVSNSLGVFGGLANPDMQRQATAENFRAEKNTDTLTTMSHFWGGFAIYLNPSMCQSYGRSGGKTNDVLRGRNILMNLSEGEV